MLRVGLTGGLASGKSTVASLLRDSGAVVFDADAMVRALYAPGGLGEASARELFGDAVFGPSGRIDRARIARIVFADPRKRHALEARIHPIVRLEISRRFAEAEKKGAHVAVAEASQLLESGMEGDYDRVLLVVAPEADRIRRWEAKGGDPEDARRRMASQISPAAASDRASDIIVNDASLDDLKRRVEGVWREWTSPPGGAGPP